MSRFTRLDFDKFFVLNRPMLAAFGTFLSTAAIALAGGIAGYSIGRVETNHLLTEQSARHTTEILRVRDEYGTKAQNTRDSVKQAAEATSEAAQAVQSIAEKIGPSVRKEAERATRAAGQAVQAQQRVEEIFPASGLPEQSIAVEPKDAPEWLGGS